MKHFSASHILSFAATFLLVLTQRLEAAVQHGPVFNPDTGNFYYLLTQNTWTLSQGEARRLGGHLVTIDDAAENDWVFKTFAAGFGSGRLLWIGLNDNSNEGVYRWTTGQVFDFSAWAPGEPNASSTAEDFIAIYYNGHSAQGLWNDWPNISSDPIGIPFMGVAEVAPNNFIPSLQNVRSLDFEGLQGMHFVAPATVPNSAYLSDQFLNSHGVRFSSGGEPAAVVQLGANHATSGINGIAGMVSSQLNYFAPIDVTFWTPQYPGIPATADFVSVRLDQLGGGNGPIQMTAFNLADELLLSTNITDVGGSVLLLAAPGMHRVLIEGNGSAALDDLVIGNLKSTRPMLSVQREGEIVRVSWPFDFFGWTLEVTDNLGAPVQWTASNSMVEFNGNELSIRAPAESPTPFFFRMRKDQP